MLLTADLRAKVADCGGAVMHSATNFGARMGAAAPALDYSRQLGAMAVRGWRLLAAVSFAAAGPRTPLLPPRSAARSRELRIPGHAGLGRARAAHGPGLQPEGERVGAGRRVQLTGARALQQPSSTRCRRCAHPTPSPQVDIYSLGVVLWELATLEVPQRGRVQPPPPSHACPAELSQLIGDCLQLEPSARPTAQQALERLQAMW